MKSILVNSDNKTLFYYDCFQYNDETFLNISITSKFNDIDESTVIEIEKTIALILENRKKLPSINSIVKSIKNVFGEFEEQNLLIELGKGGKVITNINYCDNKLQKYNNNIIINNNPIYVSYENGKNINFSIGDKENIREYKNYSEIINALKNEFSIISELSKVEVKRMFSTDEKCICKAFELFYGENPDFRTDENRIKTQVMIFLLNQIGINFENDYSFIMSNKGYPYSFELSYVINELAPLGTIPNEKYNINIKEKCIKSIQYMGEIISEYVKESGNNIVKTIGGVVYTKKYVCLTANNHEIADRLSCDEKDVFKSLQFVKRFDPLENKNNG